MIADDQQAVLVADDPAGITAIPLGLVIKLYVGLVRTEAVDNFIKNVGRIYRQQIGYPADFYICKIGGGPRKL